MNRAFSMALVLAVCAAGLAEGASITARTCGRDDVAAAINSATDGDTIVIPAGRCTWTSQLAISGKAVTIAGAGVDVTILVDGTPKGDAYTQSQMLLWYLKGSGSHRLTGVTIDGGFGVAEPYNAGVVKVVGQSVVNFRMDNFKLIARRTAGLMLYNVLGVVDHGEFVMSNAGVPGGNKFGMYVFHGSWGNVGDFGDNSWAQPSNWGSDQFLFVEDCSFTSDPNSTLGLRHSYAVDGWMGQRVVYRHNTFTNSSWANHGTESSGRWRGARAMEIYSNRFVCNTSAIQFSSAIGSRGGAALIHDNSLELSNSCYFSNFIDLAVLRANQSFLPFGKCDGSSAWDQNQAGQVGYLCLDQPGAGAGALLSGYDASPVRWPSQSREPNYIWGNSRNGVVAAADNGVSRNAQIQENRDFFKTAMPGYATYTYPHPLAGVQPRAATNVRMIR